MKSYIESNKAVKVTTEKARTAFWEVIVEGFPEIMLKINAVDLGMFNHYSDHMVFNWLYENHPENQQSPTPLPVVVGYQVISKEGELFPGTSPQEIYVLERALRQQQTDGDWYLRPVYEKDIKKPYTIIDEQGNMHRSGLTS